MKRSGFKKPVFDPNNPQYSTFKKKTFDPAKIQKHLSKKSNKKIELDRQYSKLRLVFLTLLPKCECCSTLYLEGYMNSSFTNSSTDVHHMKGRGEFYLDTTTWLSTCSKCHAWIHANPAEAKRLKLYRCNRQEAGLIIIDI